MKAASVTVRQVSASGNAVVGGKADAMQLLGANTGRRMVVLVLPEPERAPDSVLAKLWLVLHRCTLWGLEPLDVNTPTFDRPSIHVDGQALMAMVADTEPQLVVTEEARTTGYYPIELSVERDGVKVYAIATALEADRLMGRALAEPVETEPVGGEF